VYACLGRFGLSLYTHLSSMARCYLTKQSPWLHNISKVAREKDQSDPIGYLPVASDESTKRQMRQSYAGSSRTGCLTARCAEAIILEIAGICGPTDGWRD
jgi:hypothetical protein